MLRGQVLPVTGPGVTCYGPGVTCYGPGVTILCCVIRSLIVPDEGPCYNVEQCHHPNR